MTITATPRPLSSEALATSTAEGSSISVAEFISSTILDQAIAHFVSSAEIAFGHISAVDSGATGAYFNVSPSISFATSVFSISVVDNDDLPNFVLWVARLFVYSPPGASVWTLFHCGTGLTANAFVERLSAVACLLEAHTTPSADTIRTFLVFNFAHPAGKWTKLSHRSRETSTSSLSLPSKTC